MTIVKLKHSDLAQHQASIFKKLQTFRKEGMLCDVAVKSREGREHGAHTAVLCGASADLKNMLLGSFREANQVQQGQPVELAASDAVVSALLEYIYGEQPQLELEDSLELLHLADAYNFPQLVAAIEAGLRVSLDSTPVTMVLKILQLNQEMHDLKLACEEIVAANFKTCIDLVGFLELSAGQLGRILQREDLNVSSEEVVVKGLFNWFKRSKDREVHLGLLLQHVDLKSLSSDNLARLRHFFASMDSVGRVLQQQVGNALQVHKRRSAANDPGAFRPKRRCLQHWSPELGASSQAARKVLPLAWLCSHDGAIYSATMDPRGSSVLRLKPGDTESQALAGRGARVNGGNDLGPLCRVSVSPQGNIFVVDRGNHRLLSFENGSGNVVLSEVAARSVSCSPNGVVYVLTQNGRAVERLVGATLQPVISSEHLPAELQFGASDLFVTKQEVIYLSDHGNGRVLRLNPGEAEPVVVGEAPNRPRSNLQGLFVTNDDKIYAADRGQQKVWAFHPGDAAWTEVLTCAGALRPFDVVVQGRSLYVSMDGADDDAEGVFEYLLPHSLDDIDRTEDNKRQNCSRRTFALLHLQGMLVQDWL